MTGKHYLCGNMHKPGFYIHSTACLLLMLFVACSSPQNTPEEIEAPYITVTKLLSAELYGDVASARQFVDPLQVFKEARGNRLVADSLLTAQVELVRRFARDNRLPSLLAVHKCRVVQKIEGDTAHVFFLDQNGPRERVRFVLRKAPADPHWVVVQMEFNIMGSFGK
jgi:hypothetical protein